MRGYEELERKSKKYIKTQYGISEKYIVLFTGRISRRKNFPLFFEMFNRYFAGSREIGFVVIGPGLNAQTVKTAPNFHYLGPIYDEPRINELFYISDIFCVPGSLGLAIVEAMYWGLPVLTLDVFHGPEAMYLRDGYNGFILKNMHEIAKTILYLFADRNLLKTLGANARATILKEASLERMFSGFYEVLSSLS
ncbi:MAG: glycosyltransferase family 4 protein [Syntrophobacteraceae bacterium]